jgi:hypothetical protein
MEVKNHSQVLCPTNRNVQLSDDWIVTVPVFDMKSMLISILADTSRMSPNNFADGYDVLSGNVDQHHLSNNKYGEVHTGDAWIPVRDRFCSDTGRKEMPVALIVFGDKSYTNLHGTLALTPIIFTLS